MLPELAYSTGTDPTAGCLQMGRIQATHLGMCFAAAGLSATTCWMEPWGAGQACAKREQTPAF